MTTVLYLDETLLSQLRSDEKLSGSDQERVTQALHFYLRSEAGKELIAAGGQAPGMLGVPRRR